MWVNLCWIHAQVSWKIATHARKKDTHPPHVDRMFRVDFGACTAMSLLSLKLEGNGDAWKIAKNKWILCLVKNTLLKSLVRSKTQEKQTNCDTLCKREGENTRESERKSPWKTSPQRISTHHAENHVKRRSDGSQHNIARAQRIIPLTNFSALQFEKKQFSRKF